MRGIEIVGRIFLGLMAALVWVLGIAMFAGIVLGILWLLGQVTPVPDAWLRNEFVGGWELNLAKGTLTLALLIVVAGILKTLYIWGEKFGNMLAGKR